MASWPYNTKRWQRLRAAKLAQEPVCEVCQLRSRTVPAVAVDHRTSISRGGDPFPPLDALASLCERCHNEKTAAKDRNGGKGRAIKGFDQHGNPIDPDDPWNGGGLNHENRSASGPMGASNKYLVSDTYNLFSVSTGVK